MDLYVIRHADALPLAAESDDDAARPLSEIGKGQARALAATLQRRGVQLDAILRARQTADELLAHWAAPAPLVQVSELLAPGQRRKKVTREVLTVMQGSVAIVGHEPDLSAYIAWLIGGKDVHLALAKAGVAHIAFDDAGPRKGDGTLVWLVTPTWYDTPVGRS
jgi:phosphohistidine phosphatase